MARGLAGPIGVRTFSSQIPLWADPVTRYYSRIARRACHFGDNYRGQEVEPSRGPLRMNKKKKPTGKLETIPGVGPKIGQVLRDLGIRQVEDLVAQDPEAMFTALCELRGVPVDRCVLYTFRCAIYYAANSTHDPELLKWWNWMDPDQET